MTLHTLHLAKPGALTTVGALARPPTAASVAGLLHAECMMPMQLGAPIVSPKRLQVGRLAMVAAWENEDAIDAFLDGSRLGRALAPGWHVRLRFLRKWGRVAAFEPLPTAAHESDLDAPTVVITVARMKLPQVPRFLRWGLPVERLVRDHPGATLALAANRPARTIATFTVWKTGHDMLAMVHGHGAAADSDRHAVAMTERSRKDFHHEFTTLRFTCLSEHGSWEGRSAIVPRPPSDLGDAATADDGAD